MAQHHNICNKMRGPVGPQHGAPSSWRSIAFNPKENCWSYQDRSQLPASYKFDDWWDKDALEEEARLVREHIIPWSLRGPPEGPVKGDPNRQLWRGRVWRPESKKWMNRAGKNLGIRNEVAQKTKGKGKGNHKRKAKNKK